MVSSNRWSRWIAAAAALVTIGTMKNARADVPQTLVYGVYNTEHGAKDAFKLMKYSQHEGVVHIDSYAVVSKDMKGRIQVQSTQKRGARAGAVVGALIGVLGGPVGAIAGASVGGGLGYLTGRAVGIPREDIEAIKATLIPGTSAIVAVLDERWVADLDISLKEAKANQVMERKLANPTEAAPDTGVNPPESAPRP